ncbi:hypothetical protein [Marinobacter sp. KMM 10035]|uniref:hypothetical protein n=1 Tax=Marinobacter sp. KMM 10035 TaxID=3134034 RepID=UPI0039795ACB
MRTMLLAIVAISLSAWSLTSMAQEGAGKVAQSYNDSDGEGLQPRPVLDAVYPEQRRVVIDDLEYFLESSITINGQKISADGATAVLREGQRLRNVVAERKDMNGRLVLKGVDTL